MIEDWLSQLKGQWLTEVEAGRMSATELAERILQHEYRARRHTILTPIAADVARLAKSSSGKANRRR